MVSYFIKLQNSVKNKVGLFKDKKFTKKFFQDLLFSRFFLFFSMYLVFLFLKGLTGKCILAKGKSTQYGIPGHWIPFILKLA